MASTRMDLIARVSNQRVSGLRWDRVALLALALSFWAAAGLIALRFI